MSGASYQALVNKSGHLPPQTRKAIAEVLEKMAGKVVIVKIESFKKKRSSAQNRFWRGVIVPLVQQMFIDTGTPISADDTHSFLVQHVWKHVKAIALPDGEIIEVPDTSTNLTTIQWEEKIIITRAWAAEYGYILPEPNEAA